MRPFNLEKALAGEKVVNRGGYEVTEIHYFKTKKGDFPVSAVINGKVYEFKTDGRYIIGTNEHGNDLFMAPTKKKGWVNLYKHNDGSERSFIDPPEIYKTKEEALRYISADLSIKKLTITVEIERIHEGQEADTIEIEWQE